MAHLQRPVAKLEFVGEFLCLQIGEMALLRSKGALLAQKCIRLLAAGAAQRQSGSDGINARANSVRAGLRPLYFLRHPAPQPCFWPLRQTGTLLAMPHIPGGSTLVPARVRLIGRGIQG
jgi:hypothetical protein